MAQENGNGKVISNRETKNSAFITYFSEPENASQLYAALGDGEASPEDITYVTLEGVLFIARKNDLAFTVKNRVLVISEHQSTINENMPLRDLLYLGRTLEKLLDERSIYKRSLLRIPTPEFFVFYNGNDPYPTEKILRLSDAYLEKIEQPMLELTVKVININFSSGHRFLQECRPMYEYSWFIQRIKDYQADGWSRDAAITQAVKDCQSEGVLVEFIKKHGSEVANMLYTQWNWDDAMAVEREEAYAEGVSQGMTQGISQGISQGIAKGVAQGILDLLEELGEIPEDMTARIQAEESLDTLRRWHKEAARAESFTDFREKMV
ncbi:MAG: hypothetical protein HDR02_12795 [Lachnospiraceae bacterium]|nr:hypothetical protein [Lachnospiraceae bacterium]